MSVRKSLSQGSARYEFLGANDSLLKFEDLPSALAFLRAFRDSPAHMATLRDLLADTSFDVHRLEPDELLARVAGLLVNGRIKVLRTYLPSSSGTGQEPARQAGTPPAKASAGIAPAKKHWVEFRLVDDSTGDPIPGVELTIKLPDGSIEKRTTDAGGYVEVNDTLKGDCEISVEIKKDDDPSVLYEFVRME